MSDGAKGASTPVGSIKATLLGSAAIYLATVVAAVTIPAHAQTPTGAGSTSQVVSFNIRSQDLGSALTAFADRAGVRLLFQSGLVTGQRSSALVGSFTREQALSRLLAGTGLTYRFTSANTVTVSGSAAASGSGAVAVPGAIQLDTVDVSGGRPSAADAPFSTPAPVAHISQETIDRFRGSSPADIFRGTPGVMSGEARNGGGGIDVNVRGMQGMGRVATTIDGAENGMMLSQGYQGVSNRTFVDPDLLAGVDITKGSDVASRGIAGTVAMRTLNADDVVKPGEKFGVWLKAGFGTNTTMPRIGDLGGYSWPTVYYITPQPYPVPTASASGLDRPSWLDPTSGSASVVAAVKEEKYDLLWGYARRKQGNYFAGKNGPGAKVIDRGPQPLCYPTGQCLYPPDPSSYAHVYENGGLSSYRVGEQVLNTQLDTESWLAKGTVRFGEGHTLQLGYNGFRSEAGDLLASLFASPERQAVQQAQTTGTKVDTGTFRYRWNPVDNGLIDLKANMWLTDLKLRNPIRAGVLLKPEHLGLPYDYRTGNDSKMWGGDISNKSHFSLDQFGSLDLTYGMSYLKEATEPSPHSEELNSVSGRKGNRDEIAGFGKVAYKPFEWLTLNGGLRYSHYRSNDLSTPSDDINANPQRSRDGGGYSPSAGVTVEPIKGAQFYVNYSNALRMPTLFELSSPFQSIVNADLRPERSRNWEAGINVIRDSVFSANDKAMLKLGYFNWDVKDYVSRITRPYSFTSGGQTYYSTALQIYNIDRAKFEGLEFSGRYENNGFTAEVAANYYLNVAFCETAGNCNSKTIAGDYATNQIPPQYSANLTVSQKLLSDTLTVGGRVSYIGPRAAAHSEPISGAQTIIALVDWRPYWLMDVFAEYKLTKDITAWASIENVADTYYVDPLSLVTMPGPGRTFRFGLTGKFGDDFAQSIASLSNPSLSRSSAPNWTGFHVGGHAAYNFARFRGVTTTANGSLVEREAPDRNIDGFSFGAHAGYDYQFNNGWIAGFEADVARMQIGESKAIYSNEGSTGAGPTNLNWSRQYEAVRDSSADWLATVRGRLGYAIDDKLMVYATAGAAFLRQNESRTQYVAFTDGGGAPRVTEASFMENVSLTRTGYAVGGGAEYKVGGGWSLKGEFLFARFGKKEVEFPDARAGVMPDTSERVLVTPAVPTSYNLPICVSQGFTAPGCIIPGTPAVYQTVVHPGSSNQTTGRKLLSKIDIPMIKVGLTYRF